MRSITWRSWLRVAAWAITSALSVVAFALDDLIGAGVLAAYALVGAAMTVRAYRQHRWRMRAYERLFASIRAVAEEEGRRERMRQAAPLN